MRISARNWYFIGFGLLSVATLIDWYGVSSWPLVWVLFSLLTVLYGQKTGFVLATALSTVSLLALVACWYQVAPALPGELRNNTVILGIIAGVGLILSSGIGRTVVLPSRRAIQYFWPAFVVPCFAGLLILLLGASRQLGYSWAMQNDAVWNLVVSRFVTQDGGILSGIHPNPSPLVPELLSFSTLSGRELQSAETLFRHDITRAAETWLLMALLSSVLAGLMMLSTRQIKPFWLKFFAAIVVSALPLVWFTFGYALEFGFYNATLALLLLLAIWLIWERGPNFPYFQLGGLGLSLICCLAAWGPLAIIPASMAFACLIRAFTRKRPPQTIGELVFAVFSLSLSVIYGLFITLPDLRNQSDSLGSDGGIFEITPISAFLTITFCVVVIGLVSFLLKDKNSLWGMLLLVASSLLAITYLALQRGPDVSKWGYYPLKYSWLLMCLLIILVTAYALAWISSLNLKTLKSLALTSVSGIVIFLVAWQMPIRTLPTYISVFPIANIATHTGIAREDSFAERLFSLAIAGKPAIAFMGPNPASDQFANRWLLQLESRTSEDQIRFWAYFLNPNNPDDLCKALESWPTEVRVITSANNLEEILYQQCPDASFELVRKN